jgi:hypothetical protein
MLAIENGADPIDQFLGGQRCPRLHDAALAMSPLGFDGIQPGAHGRQATDQDAYTRPLALHLTVVGANPAAHLPADVPGGVVPEQSQDSFAQGLQLATTLVQELGGNAANRTIIHESQPGLLLDLSIRGGPAHQHPVAGQGFS